MSQGLDLVLDMPRSHMQQKYTCPGGLEISYDAGLHTKTTCARCPAHSSPFTASGQKKMPMPYIIFCFLLSLTYFFRYVVFRYVLILFFRSFIMSFVIYVFRSFFIFCFYICIFLAFVFSFSCGSDHAGVPAGVLRVHGDQLLLLEVQCASRAPGVPGS